MFKNNIGECFICLYDVFGLNELSEQLTAMLHILHAIAQTDLFEIRVKPKRLNFFIDFMEETVDFFGVCLEFWFLKDIKHPVVNE